MWASGRPIRGPDRPGASHPVSDLRCRWAPPPPSGVGTRHVACPPPCGAETSSCFRDRDSQQFIAGRGGGEGKLWVLLALRPSTPAMQQDPQEKCDKSRCQDLPATYKIRTFTVGL